MNARPMFHRPSPTLRAARALTAVVTVWCLGCSGFEPLLDALLGEEAGSTMACAPSSDPTDGTTSGAVSDLSTAEDAVVAAPAAAHRGFECGCGQSCQSTTLPGTYVAPPLAGVPHIAAADVTPPPSVVRTPLLPPPERSA